MGISKTIPWRRFATPDGEFTYTASAGTTASIDFSSVSEPFTVSWGDGAADIISSSGTITHIYQSSGDFPIKLFEADNNVLTINLKRDSNYKSCTKLPKGLKKVDFSFTGINYKTNIFPDGVTNLNCRFCDGEGPVSDLPGGADFYGFDNNNKINGAPGDVPRGAPGAQYLFNGVLSGGSIGDMPGDGSVLKLPRCSNIGQFQNAPNGYKTYNVKNSGIGGTLQGGPTSYTKLDIINTSVSGDFADIPNGAANLDLINSNVNGDVAEFAQITTANTLDKIRTNVPPCTYSGATWNRYDGARLQFKVELSSAEVDSLLIDLNDSGIKNGTLDLGGDNSPRTSTSDQAVSDLQSRGSTITVNT